LHVPRQGARLVIGKRERIHEPIDLDRPAAKSGVFEGGMDYDAPGAELDLIVVGPLRLRHRCGHHTPVGPRRTWWTMAAGYGPSLICRPALSASVS